MTIYRIAMTGAAAMLIVSCTPAPNSAPDGNNIIVVPEPTSTARAAAWSLISSDEGTGLNFADGAGNTLIHLFCPARGGTIAVNVPSFRAIGSEERMSFGAGSVVVALAADPAGDPLRGGVTGEEPVPDELDTILSSGPGASYGAQNAGPFVAVPEDDRKAFLAACRGQVPLPSPAPSPTPTPAPTASPSPSPSPTPSSSATSALTACRLQDGKPLLDPAIKATGTEPFWGARVEGRCVTYSTPENAGGTRVWTRYDRTPAGRRWAGNLDGKPFELVLAPAPGKGCSDGMSDRRYPLTATLKVAGGTRNGCAAPEKAK